MKILPIGIAPYADMKARAMAIARGELKSGPDEPKLWFASIESPFSVSGTWRSISTGSSSTTPGDLFSRSE